MKINKGVIMFTYHETALLLNAEQKAIVEKELDRLYTGIDFTIFCYKYNHLHDDLISYEEALMVGCNHVEPDGAIYKRVEISFYADGRHLAIIRSL
jgi:hypothetical protein